MQQYTTNALLNSHLTEQLAAQLYHSQVCFLLFISATGDKICGTDFTFIQSYIATVLNHAEAASKSPPLS